MIQIRNTKVKSTLDELTVQEFQECSDILENKLESSYILKWLKVLEKLGVSPETTSRVTADELKNFISNFCQGGFYNWDPSSSQDIGGVPYKSVLRDHDIPVKTLVNVEKKIKLSGKFNISEIIALICVPVEGIDPYSLEEKKEFIEKDPISKWLPFASKVAELLTEKFFLFSNE